MTSQDPSIALEIHFIDPEVPGEVYFDSGPGTDPFVLITGQPPGPHDEPHVEGRLIIETQFPDVGHVNALVEALENVVEAIRSSTFIAEREA